MVNTYKASPQKAETGGLLGLFGKKQPSWISTPGSVRDCISKNKVGERLKRTWDTDPPHTHACVPTQVQIKEQITGNGSPPPLPWNMYLNGKLLNLYPITNKNGKPWWFVFLSKVLKEILFSGAWGRKGWGPGGFLPLTESPIFSLWSLSIEEKVAMFRKASNADIFLHGKLPPKGWFQQR